MNHLMRELAPLSDDSWRAIENEATRTLRHFMAARKLIRFEGPLGWEVAALPAGGCAEVDSSPAEGVEAAIRRVMALVEMRAVFTLSRAVLDEIDRAASGPDLSAVVDASRRLALAEDRAVFHGYAPGGITGLTDSSPHPAIHIGDDYDQYPGLVARGVAQLRDAGVDGPYGIALGPKCYTGVVETTEHGGYPVLDHIHSVLGGPVVWAPAVDGAVVVSMRGNDFRLLCGQDVSVGYRSHDGGRVTLYLEETITFMVDSPEASVALTYET